MFTPIDDMERRFDLVLVEAVRADPDGFIDLVESHDLNDLSRIVGLIAKLQTQGSPPAWQLDTKDRRHG